MSRARDKELLAIFLEPIARCAEYRPAFGLDREEGIDAGAFAELYGQDFFYNTIGLASSEMYIAHRAAGGITSIYRQLGIGSERLLQRVFCDSLRIPEAAIQWSYEYPKANGKTATHTLDAYVEFGRLGIAERKRFRSWAKTASASTGGPPSPTRLKGIAFEIRQGYKSADSKRQSADLRFGMRAYQAGILPVFLILSDQISSTVAKRYRADGMLVLSGNRGGDPLASTYSFMNEIVGFDLESFFINNANEIRASVKSAVRSLLSAE